MYTPSLYDMKHTINANLSLASPNRPRTTHFLHNIQSSYIYIYIFHSQSEDTRAH
jgi:hypothetical protein